MIALTQDVSESVVRLPGHYWVTSKRGKPEVAHWDGKLWTRLAHNKCTDIVFKNISSYRLPEMSIDDSDELKVADSRPTDDLNSIDEILKLS